MHNGIINVYKEPGYTSFDVVAILRKTLSQKKIGHTGTLDPQAEGVLPVCLGNGTKLCDMFTDKNKEYECTMLLGMTSDTEDAEGTIITKCDVLPSEEDVRAAVMSFVNDEYMQVPPMYSALKVNGKKMYELAREGKVIERQPRKVSIYGIDILDVSMPRVRFKVQCSKGTYIRSLCRDIGDKLGCGAIMEHLIRTKTGPFTIDKALKLDDITRYVDEGIISSYIVTTEDALSEFETLHVTMEFKKKIDNGNPLPANAFIEKVDEACKMYRVYNVENKFFALYTYDNDRGELMPEKIFPLG